MREGLTSELPELHSTPWSSVQALNPEHPKAQEFNQRPPIGTGSSIELDLDTLLSQKYSGKTDRTIRRIRFSSSDTRSSARKSLQNHFPCSVVGAVELRVQVVSFHFQHSQAFQNAPRTVLDSATQLDSIVAVLTGDIIYTGCGCCATELDTDANGIYVPCYPCLPHMAVRRYYR